MFAHWDTAISKIYCDITRGFFGIPRASILILRLHSSLPQNSE